MLRLDDMFKLPVIVPPASGNFVVSSIVTFEAPVTRPFESTVTCETCCAEPYVAAVTAVFANVNAPAFEIVASPLIATAVATPPALPINMFPEANASVIGVNPKAVLTSVAAVPNANDCVEPVNPFKLVTPDPAIPRACSADPSQYITVFVVLLNHVRPLSPATKVPTNAVCSAAVKLLNPT